MPLHKIAHPRLRTSAVHLDNNFALPRHELLTAHGRAWCQAYWRAVLRAPRASTLSQFLLLTLCPFWSCCFSFSHFLLVGKCFNHDLANSTNLLIRSTRRTEVMGPPSCVVCRAR